MILRVPFHFQGKKSLMIKEWTMYKDTAFVTDGLEYKDDHLIVHKKGTYCIYSNVAFFKY